MNRKKLEQEIEDLKKKLQEATSDNEKMKNKQKETEQKMNELQDECDKNASEKDALAKKAEMNIIGYNYQQERSFDTLEGAAKNPGTLMVPGFFSSLGGFSGSPPALLLLQKKFPELLTVPGTLVFRHKRPVSFFYFLL